MSEESGSETNQFASRRTVTLAYFTSIEDSVEEVIEAGGVPGVLSDQFNFDSSLFPEEREMKPRLSRSEKRRARQAYTQGGTSTGETAHPLEVSIGRGATVTAGRRLYSRGRSTNGKRGVAHGRPRILP